MRKVLALVVATVVGFVITFLVMERDRQKGWIIND